MRNLISKSQATMPVFWEAIPLQEFYLLCILVALQGREEEDVSSTPRELSWLLSYWRATRKQWSGEEIAEMLMYGRPGYDEQTDTEILELLGNHIGSTDGAKVAPYHLNDFVEWAWGCYIPWAAE